MMLTKSNYLRYRQCKKYLWLNKKRKDLLSEVSDQQQAIFDQGYLVESYAQRLFPEAKTVCNDVFKAEKETIEVVKAGAKTIFQATAISDELLVRADIFKFNVETNVWDIYEVKSANEAHKENFFDICFQKIVFEKAGYKIGKVSLIHINKDFVKNGEIKPEELLVVEDVTEQIENLKSIIEADIPKALAILELQEEPHVKIIKQCYSPYECPFVDYCWKDIPEYSVYDLQRIKDTKLVELLHMKVMEVKDIPEDFPMSDSQLNQVVVSKTGKPIIDKENIAATLNGLSYPLYFLDYETFAPAIPLFDGLKPYQQMCFQYSLHVLAKKGGEIEHYEFLAKDKNNPIPALAKQLKQDIAADNGTVVVWNKSFEMSRNTEMGAMYPEYKEFMASVNARVFDLMEIFRKQYYVHPDFRGSCSIKKVLTVLVPELSYKTLGIQEGGTASRSYFEMNFSEMEAAKHDQIYNDLLKYCELDSLAMVRIFQVLQRIL